MTFTYVEILIVLQVKYKIFQILTSGWVWNKYICSGIIHFLIKDFFVHNLHNAKLEWLFFFSTVLIFASCIFSMSNPYNVTFQGRSKCIIMFPRIASKWYKHHNKWLSYFLTHTSAQWKRFDTESTLGLSKPQGEFYLKSHIIVLS